MTCSVGSHRPEVREEGRPRPEVMSPVEKSYRPEVTDGEGESHRTEVRVPGVEP